MKTQSKLLKKIKGLLILGIVIVIAMLAYQGWQTWQQNQQPAMLEPEVPKETIPLPTGSDFPTDQLIITEARQQYQNDSMTLKIPALDITVALKDGTTLATLKQGPGLYEYSQMPDEGNANVSIAGHRDIHGSIFYYVDQLTQGDLLYVIYDDKIYQYCYQETTVITPDDWSVIYNQGYNCLTLTSCTPIGVSSHRIVIRAELIDIIDQTTKEEFSYPVKQTELTP